MGEAATLAAPAGFDEPVDNATVAFVAKSGQIGVNAEHVVPGDHFPDGVALHNKQSEGVPFPSSMPHYMCYSPANKLVYPLFSHKFQTRHEYPQEKLILNTLPNKELFVMGNKLKLWPLSLEGSEEAHAAPSFCGELPLILFVLAFVDSVPSANVSCRNFLGETLVP